MGAGGPDVVEEDSRVPDRTEDVRERTGGEGGGEGGDTDIGATAEGGIGDIGIKPPGRVVPDWSAVFCVCSAGLLERAPDWLTFLIVSIVCLYAWMNARHAPEIERIAERKNMTRDWKEEELERCGSGVSAFVSREESDA